MSGPIAVLLLESPRSLGAILRFRQPTVRIGSCPQDDIVLADAALDRSSVALAHESGTWTARNLSLSSHPLLNGRALRSPAVLRSGDRLALGRTSMVFDPPPEAFIRLAQAAARFQGDPGHARMPRLVGSSATMSAVRSEIEYLAPCDVGVLVTGETGTGKEIAARLLHDGSPRRDAAFVVVNCPALVDTLVEAELFGTARGIATGVEDRPGLLESADGGTLFLDEVGDLSPAAQAKLLRFLDTHCVERVGARHARHVDVRIVAATNADLAGRVRWDPLESTCRHASLSIL